VVLASTRLRTPAKENKAKVKRDWRKLHNEKLQKIFSSPDIKRVGK
jgi:hypothetical protein